MLRRGFKPQPHSQDEDSGRPLRLEKKSTPIYLHDPNCAWPDVAVKSQGPKLVRDRLLELMSDSEYHSAQDLEQALPNGEWVRAMKELLALRFAFDRLSHSFRIRHRLSTEKKQVLVELLAGIDATKLETPASLLVEENQKSVSDRKVPEQVDEEGEAFDPTEDAKEDIVEGEQLIMSEDPAELTLSAMDTTTMTAAILAKKSSGKTYLGMVLAEELMASPGLRVPVVIVDPTGVWYGLRAMADGTPSSFKILTLGGLYGDAEITNKQGLLVAEIVNEVRPKSVLLDLSLMTPSEQHEFVADFGQRLFVLNVRSPLHLIVDEVDEFAPQVLNSSSRHQKRSLEVIDRIVRRGRTKGFGATLITQRSAVIAKNVISQIDSLFLLNMVAPSDLEAVDAWMRHGVSAGQRIECLGNLPNLSPGTAYFMQNGAVPKFRRFNVRRRKTFDSSRTPKPNEEFVSPVLATASEDDVAVAKKWLSVEPPKTPEIRFDAEG